MLRRNWIVFCLFGLTPVCGYCADSASTANSETITVDASAPAHDFPHYWEKMFGSGRAVLALRENYRRDLRDTKEITDFEYVRAHAIFHDEIGVYDEDSSGHPIYNFSYVDQIYDNLLAAGVRPFVELSFMPRKLASRESIHPFWYKPNVSPPKDYARWDGLISEFARHLVGRYGIQEVSKWYFEVWNEPNLDFWAGIPAQASYWELYDHTARALKAVDVRLRVGGPATAQAAWVDAMIAHATQFNVPLDFVSTHVYGNDTADNVFGTNEKIPQDKMVCRAVRKVHDQIKSSAQPALPLIWSEFNASYGNDPAVTDAVYMGPWMADTIRQCDGLVDMMSYWTFSDVFEEQGVTKGPFRGGFGLLGMGGIPKPAFNAFKILHRLGTQRLAVDSDSVLATRRLDGSLVLALWNYAPYDAPGPAKTVTLQFKRLDAKNAKVWRVDAEHGDVHPAYKAMGSPQSPTLAQIVSLKQAGALLPAETVKLHADKLTLQLPTYGLVVVELGSGR
jgi:xylan 1,4-beta-xylosidase